MRFLRLAICATLLSSSTTLYAQTSDRRDGNWWTNQTRPYKLAYVVGFFDGMELGHRFSYWGLKSPASSGVVGSYSSHVDKYLSNVTNDQLVDGLDAFFKDYRNRRLRLYDAVWLVCNGIAGVPESKLNQMIESFRANATGEVQ